MSTPKWHGHGERSGHATEQERADTVDDLVAETERLRRQLMTTVDRVDQYARDLLAEVKRRTDARGEQ